MASCLELLGAQRSEKVVLMARSFHGMTRGFITCSDCNIASHTSRSDIKDSQGEVQGEPVALGEPSRFPALPQAAFR